MVSALMVVPQERQCRLIQGAVALSAQLVLLTVVLTALAIKRHRERPRRPWNVWLLDISKQACSAGAGHAVGMLVAIIAHSSSGHASECGWYFVVYFADCSLGITLAITFHKLTTYTANYYNQKNGTSKDYNDEHPWWEALVEIGYYGDANAPNYRKWAIQVAAWVSCVVTARVITGCVVIALIPVFKMLTAFLDSQFQGKPEMYLFTVMVGIPVVVNIGQAWIQDQVLKWKHKKPHAFKRAESSDPQASDDEQSIQVLSSLPQWTKASERILTDKQIV